MKKLILAIAIIAFVCVSFKAQAQQEPRYSQYMFNKMVINPAYAGSLGTLQLTGLYRTQWVNIDGAPNTTTLSAHTAFGERKQYGIGGHILYDQIGVTDQVDVYGSFAYNFNVGKSKLALGMQGGVSYFNGDYASLLGNNEININIDNILSQSYRALLPNFGLGLFLHDAKKYYLGVSVPRLLNSDLTSDEGTFQLDQPHYHFMGGYVFNASPNFKIVPSFLVKTIPGRAPVQLDANLLFAIQKVLWIGGSYRTGFGNNDIFAEPESINGIIAFDIGSTGLRIGYAYDYTLSKLQNFTTGSHEIMLSYLLPGETERIIDPRVFRNYF